jgi:glycosyltransferase involved in cell wall biosynthesis
MPECVGGGHARGELQFAFYGRVPTEDQQVPESSRGWQERAVNEFSWDAVATRTAELYAELVS